jgi:hypothetical protein
MSRKIFLFSILFFLTLFDVSAKDDLCDVSRPCRKACDLKIAGKFDDFDQDHQELLAKCALDLMKMQDQQPQ